MSAEQLNEWGLPIGTEPHNPDSLTAEQITEGGKWRAVTLEECDGRHKGAVEVWDCGWCVTTYGNHNFQTYRVPADTPLPQQPAPAESGTPRTDALLGDPNLRSTTSMCSLARTLETELNAALAQRDEARRLLGEARDHLEHLRLACNGPVPISRTTLFKVEETEFKITNHLK